MVGSDWTYLSYWKVRKKNSLILLRKTGENSWFNLSNKSPKLCSVVGMIFGVLFGTRNLFAWRLCVIIKQFVFIPITLFVYRSSSLKQLISQHLNEFECHIFYFCFFFYWLRIWIETGLSGTTKDTKKKIE